jgi:acyl-CoA thioester hydrolase
MPIERPTRDAYARFTPMTTRLRDNDQYLHLNNAVYYEYFDSAVNLWLIERCGLELPNGPVVGIVADTQCTFLAEVKWPSKVEVGMRMDRIGRSSLTYGLALFTEGEERANAVCRYVHVYCVNPARRPTPLPDLLKAEAEKLVVGEAAA